MTNEKTNEEIEVIEFTDPLCSIELEIVCGSENGQETKGQRATDGGADFWLDEIWLLIGRGGDRPGKFQHIE